jgi:lysophospholipase L1-like esterase
MNSFRLSARSVIVFLLCLSTAQIAHVQQAAAHDPQTDGVVRENIEWLDVWTPDTGVTNLPRVLLLGDSITRAYYSAVAERLKGKAVVARLATSKCAGDPVLVQEVSLLLSQYHFDVIHFNNGMHGWGYSEQTYQEGLKQLIDTLKKDAPGARLIWATTTPVRDPAELSHLADRTGRVQARNKLAGTIVAAQGIPVDDLYSLVINHPEYWKPDGVHFNDSGVAVESAQVAQRISELLR